MIDIEGALDGFFLRKLREGLGDVTYDLVSERFMDSGFGDIDGVSLANILSVLDQLNLSYYFGNVKIMFDSANAPDRDITLDGIRERASGLCNRLNAVKERRNAVVLSIIFMDYFLSRTNDLEVLFGGGTGIKGRDDNLEDRTNVISSNGSEKQTLYDSLRNILISYYKLIKNYQRGVDFMSVEPFFYRKICERLYRYGLDLSTFGADDGNHRRALSAAVDYVLCIPQPREKMEILLEAEEVFCKIINTSDDYNTQQIAFLSLFLYYDNSVRQQVNQDYVMYVYDYLSQAYDMLEDAIDSFQLGPNHGRKGNSVSNLWEIAHILKHSNENVSRFLTEVNSSQLPVLDDSMTVNVCFRRAYDLFLPVADRMITLGIIPEKDVPSFRHNPYRV